METGIQKMKKSTSERPSQPVRPGINARGKCQRPSITPKIKAEAVALNRACRFGRAYPPQHF